MDVKRALSCIEAEAADAAVQSLAAEREIVRREELSAAALAAEVGCPRHACMELK